MAYYALLGGYGSFYSDTLGNLISGMPKIKVTIKHFYFPTSSTNAILSQGGSTFGNREFVLRTNANGNIEIFVGGTSSYICTTAQAATAFGNANLSCDEFGFELDGTTARLYKDGVAVITKTGVSRGAVRVNNAFFRLGAQAATDGATDPSAGTYAPNGAQFGDVKVYINDALVRDYTMPSSGTTVADSVGGNALTQQGTWPANDDEWIFYSTGGGTITASVAATMPQMTAAANASKSAPVYTASIAATMPQMAVAAAGQAIAPSSGAVINFTMPQMVAAISADNSVPVFATAVSVTMPQFTASASAENTLPTGGAVVSFAMPQMVVSASASKTAPTFSASIAATMPQFTVSATGQSLVDTKTASISFTMPQMVVASTASNVVPIRQASIAFTMPQMRVSVLTGGVAFYNDPRAHVELVAASRHIEYTNQSRHIELRSA